MSNTKYRSIRADLARRAGLRDPEKTICECVRSIKREFGLTDPIDVRELAHQLGIVVHETDLPFPGVISKLRDGSYEVRIKRQLRNGQKNFTMAHELGHFLLFERIPNYYQVARRHGTENPFEETLCNLAANEITMPEAYLMRRLAQLGVSANSMSQITKELNVTWKNLLIRVSRLLNHHLSANDVRLVTWKVSDGSFVPSELFPFHRLGRFPSRTDSVEEAYVTRTAAWHTEIETSYRLNVLSWRLGERDEVLSMIWEGEFLEMARYVDGGPREHTTEYQWMRAMELQRAREILSLEERKAIDDEIEASTDGFLKTWETGAGDAQLQWMRWGIIEKCRQTSADRLIEERYLHVLSSRSLQDSLLSSLSQNGCTSRRQ